MKKMLVKFINILLLLAICCSLVEPFVKTDVVYAETNTHVYLSDLWDTDKLLYKESSWKDARALKINQNEPGNLMSLNINGEQTYFLNGLFAHAASTLIFDISEYTAQGFDTFSAYVGVDTYASSNGDGVYFVISASKDNKEYTTLKTTGTFKGNNDGEKIELRVGEYKYLKLVANANRNNSSDHSVYANAMLFDSKKYVPNTNSSVDWIKNITEYDSELKNKSAEKIISDDDLELKLLQRTLVKRVGYQIIQAYATSDDKDKVDALYWLFTNKEILKKYITGGEPLGNYINSFNVLAKLYKEYKGDLTNYNYTDTQRETFLKMMLAISLTHSSQVSFWTTGAGNTPVVSNPVERYRSFKKLYTQSDLPMSYDQTFDAQNFESLTIEEMRWVVDARLSDEEIPWLNWYTSANFEETKYRGDGEKPKNSMDPYTYIWYNDSFKWAYTDENYYKDNSNYCAADINTPGNTGYKRGAVCNDIYHTKEWGIESNTNTQPRLWVVWEEDGVCGALSKTGENLHNSYGQVAAVTRQPAHAAYLRQTKTKNEDGTYTSTWSIGNDVRGWALSSGTEKGERMPLNWGTTTNSYASYYNGSYVILAQRAIDNFDDYVKSLEYKLIADIYEDDLTEQRKIYREIVGHTDENNKLASKNIDGIQTYNLDGWYGLIQTYLKDGSMSSEDYAELAFEIMDNLEEFPLPMTDMLNLIKEKITDGEDSIPVNIAYQSLLKRLSTTPNNSDKYLQGQAVRQVAEYLLGLENEKPVSFSLDGENANKIVLATKTPFEYSLDYTYDAEANEVKATWEYSDGSDVDLSDRLDEISDLNDIVIWINGDPDRTPTSEHIIVIDIQEGSTPKGLYANDLENKVIGTTDSMEWKIDTGEEVNNNGWVKFSQELPNLEGLKTVLVRDGAHENYLASDYVSLSFDTDPEADKTKVYVPISRLSVTASSRQNNNEHETKAIDGNINTYWHNLWNKADTEKWIQLEITDEPIDLSKIEYVPRQDSGTNGTITKAKLEVSLDGENWQLVDDNISWNADKTRKSYVLDKPVLAKYVRLTALESMGTYFASAAMVNLFESTVARTDVNDLTVNYMASGFVYDGNAKMPVVTVKNGENLLVLDEDYTIEYSNNVNVGTAMFTIKGKGAYKGKRSFEFEIGKASSPAVMPAEEIIVEEKNLYYMDEYMPYLMFVPLPDNWGWDPNMADTPIQPGESIMAKAIYYGEDLDSYETTETMVKVTRIIGNRPEVELINDEVRFDITTEEVKTMDYFKTLLKITDVEDDANSLALNVIVNEELTDWDGSWDKVGTYHITYTITDSDNNKVDYTIQLILYDSNMDKIDLTQEGFIVEVEESRYNGLELKPRVVIKDANGHILTENTDYVVSYANNILAGIAKVVIEGIGLYTGELTNEFEIKKALVPEVLPSHIIEVSQSATSLSDINLPLGWSWQDEDIKLAEGENELVIVYAGDENHEAYEMKVVVVKNSLKTREIVEPEVIEEDENKEEDNNQDTVQVPPVVNEDSNEQNSNEGVENNKVVPNVRENVNNTNDEIDEDTTLEEETVDDSMMEEDKEEKQDTINDNTVTKQQENSKTAVTNSVKNEKNNKIIPIIIIGSVITIMIVGLVFVLVKIK